MEVRVSWITWIAIEGVGIIRSGVFEVNSNRILGVVALSSL